MQRCPLSLLLFNIFLLSSSELNKVKKGNKHHSDQKGKNETLPIFNGMIEIKNTVPFVIIKK